MSNINSSTIIATLLNDTQKPIFLLGGGASVTSGIPLAGEIVNLAAKWAYAREHAKNPDDPRITKSDWYPWLLSRHSSWFKEETPPASLFPYAVENLLNPQKTRKEFWIKILNPDVKSSIGYLRLVELMHLNKIRNVLTTNFDACILNARTERNRPHHLDVIDNPSDYTKISSTPSWPSLIYLHGAVENYTDKNLIEEVETLDENLVNNLVPLLKDYPLVVIGYRGYEKSVMQHLLINNAARTFNYKNGIYWCLKRGEKAEDATPFVKQLALTIGTNFQFVEIESFDNLFDKVIWPYLEDEKSEINPVREFQNLDFKPIEIKNFDLKVAAEYDENDLDKPLFRSRITNYCTKLNVFIPEKIEDEWLINQAQNLNLIRKSKNGMSVTNAGLLLFAKDTQTLIPSATILVRFLGPAIWLRKVFKDESIQEDFVERTIGGNLWSQVNDITDALSLVNKRFRLKDEKSIDVMPYDPIALKEVIVNSLVHREYETNLNNLIEVHADRIIVKNPGGLMEEVIPAFEDTDMMREIKKGVRGVKGYRNPALADLFYSSGDMDKRGSGLYDVVYRSEQNSGSVNFGPNLSNTEFEVTLWSRPEAVDEITNTAVTLNIVTTKFSTNIIEIEKLPDYIYSAPFICKNVKEMFELYPTVRFPPFTITENMVFSFTELNKSNNALRNIIDLTAVTHLLINELVEKPEGEKMLVRMLNDYLRSYMMKLGLIVDPKKKRAYFPKTEDGERVISYQARFKKATRTVVRPRYNAAKDKIRYWEHKAFYYSVKRYGDDWTIIIESSYVFTLDGYKNLFAPLKTGALATKKASRDYNINVLNDLTFWLWALAKGATGVFRINASEHENLGDELILKRDFLTQNLNNVESLIEDVDIDNGDLEDLDIDEEIGQIADEERQELSKD